MAWIEALRKAEKNIPQPIIQALNSLGLNSSLGRLAACALACPVYLVTPESSLTQEIRVYLNDPNEAAYQKIILQPEALVLEMFLIRDLEKNINFLARHWPQSLKEAWDRREELERYFLSLDCLWEILYPNPAETLKSLPEDKLEEMASLLEDSPVLWMLVAKAKEEAKLPQAALEATEKAIKYVRSDLPRDKLLAARIYYIRAQAHWELSQPALAENDLETAASYLTQAGVNSPLLHKIYGRLGDYYSIRQNYEGMCGAYSSACASGDCSRLAAMLREGRCASETAINPDNHYDTAAPD